MRLATNSPQIDTQLPVPPDVSSIGRPWGGVTVQIHHWRAAGSVISPALDHDILAMRLAGHAALEQRRLGKIHRSLVVPGNLGLHPRHVESRWSWDRPGSIVVSRIPQSLLIEAAEVVLRQPGEQHVLCNCFGVRDAFAETVLFTLAREIQLDAHPAQRLIAESLSCALAAHLVYRFNVRHANACASVKGLHPRALGRVLDFLHESTGAVSLQDMADIAQVSRFHFARMFKLSTGETAMAYLERIRLLRARELLLSGEYSVASIAAQLGFADQSHFGRRFRRYFGCSPREYGQREPWAGRKGPPEGPALPQGWRPATFGAVVPPQWENFVRREQ
ncbi:AraC family transcriptional regulator [Cupriavidus sp. AU9028]|uniref:helix-turn-helix transcriptional regulator n=1 Tax=Cupriavidus sp. AU9028 TaxID=2871157 RepID=UPI002103D522|nr:AraC family transcriptional regulator [Cupriavidus sp. AU9028]